MATELGEIEKQWQNGCFTGENAAYLESFSDDNPQKAACGEFLKLSRVKKNFPIYTDEAPSVLIEKQMRVFALMTEYRLVGHRQASLDPLGLWEVPFVPQLTLEYHNLSAKDFNHTFRLDYFRETESKTLSQIYQDLNTIYCGTVASEFMHISDPNERTWLRDKIESTLLALPLTDAEKITILEKLIAAEGLEKHLASKYPGAKRFGLEGAESLMVALDQIIQKSGQYGIREIVIGMAHRGRLNVLVNILGKRSQELFEEFEDTQQMDLTLGDVKYHQGFSSNIATEGGNVHLSLAFNPSHLESVGPVVCGSVRARSEKRGDLNFLKELPILVHGDAAFSGQGIVMETLNMSQTSGFTVGGTLHIIINNQIGFTTSDSKEARSTLYCSDVAKMLQAPIFHVNGEDPEKVALIAQIALAYRNKYQKDVVIDIVCYRRHGHNEADDPFVTQPTMYQVIQKKKSLPIVYADKLMQENCLTPENHERMKQNYRALLESTQQVAVKNLATDWVRKHEIDWTPYFGKDWREPVKTALPLDRLKSLANQRDKLPEGFVLHPRVAKIIEARKKMTQGDLPLDWGYAETLAYASLVTEHYGIRLSGQDSGRGTFFHRHAILYDQNTAKRFVPLACIDEHQASFTVVNSLLSEAAVLGFEYGYSTTIPDTLVIWEAQFGDFANGAQVMIDQFISSGEHKWGRLSGLTLFLPHGYEGQGPEHSSARIERYLQLCAEQNIQLCLPTTPAQIFHLLRRQMLRKMRKPLVVFTPKSLLRHKAASSSLEQLSDGEFQPIIADTLTHPKSEITRVILCAGKVYYDLVEKRTQANLAIALIRIEQLYPFPETELKNLLADYQTSEILWVQEEPENQGAWYSSKHHFFSSLQAYQKLYFVGRKASSAPSVGYARLHLEQQEMLVRQALHEPVINPEFEQ